MANRQYVGARYVPKFYQGSNGNEWDSGVAYEPLTCVTYLNNSYTSKKPVPARTVTPNLDTEYWVMTGNYNSQVGVLAERVDVIEGDIVNINTDISAIETALDNTNTKKVVIIGDSYGVDASAGGTSWATIVENKLGSSNVIRNTIGGTGFGSDVYITENNLSMLQSLEIEDKTSITDIVVIGGANDANLLNNGSLTEASLITKIRNFITYCKTYFTNAKVKIAFVGWNRVASLDNYIKCASIYQNICNEFSNAKYYCKGEVIMHNMSFINTNDNIHPTQTASNYLGLFAVSMINDGDFNYVISYQMVTNPSLNTGYSINGNMYLYVRQNDETTEMSMLGNSNGVYVDLRPSTPIEFSNSSCIFSSIGTFDNMVKGRNGFYNFKTLEGVVGVTGVGAKKCKILMTYQDNEWSFRIFAIEDVTSGTISNVLIPPFGLSYPTRLN